MRYSAEQWPLVDWLRLWLGYEAQVRSLLLGSPGCAVLVTSRSRMAALAGATAVPLDLMPPGQAAGLLTAIIGESRGRRQRYAAGAQQMGCAGRSGFTFRDEMGRARAGNRLLRFCWLAAG